MSTITSTNIRVGPGFYSAIKHMSETSGLSMGVVANFLFMIAFGQFKENALKSFPADIQQTLVADIFSSLGDIFKLIGLSVIQDPGLATLYRRLLNPDEKKE